MSCASSPMGTAVCGWCGPSQWRPTRTGSSSIATSTWTICASTRRRRCAVRPDPRPVQPGTVLARSRTLHITSDLARDKKHCAPYLGALGHLLSRAPLYAGPETVLAPDVVERAYESFRTFDWTAPELAEMQTLFLRAARVIGSRSFDLPKALRHRIAAKLENSGVAPQKTGKLKDFMPLGSSERISLHDESLPPGLILTES